MWRLFFTVKIAVIHVSCITPLQPDMYNKHLPHKAIKLVIKTFILSFSFICIFRPLCDHYNVCILNKACYAMSSPVNRVPTSNSWWHFCNCLSLMTVCVCVSNDDSPKLPVFLDEIPLKSEEALPGEPTGLVWGYRIFFGIFLGSTSCKSNPWGRRSW